MVSISHFSYLSIYLGPGGYSSSTAASAASNPLIIICYCSPLVVLSLAVLFYFYKLASSRKHVQVSRCPVSRCPVTRGTRTRGPGTGTKKGQAQWKNYKWRSTRPLNFARPLPPFSKRKLNNASARIYYATVFTMRRCECHSVIMRALFSYSFKN